MAVKSTVTWNGKQFYEKTRKEQVRRMELATRFLVNKVKERISTKGAAGRNSKGRFTRGGHSTRGNPPFLQTGQLRRSIAQAVDSSGSAVKGRVGTNVFYALYLESPRYLDRSFLLSTLHLHKGDVRKILAGGT